MGALRVWVSASADDRLSRARDAVRALAPATRILIVGASRGAADDFARDIAASSAATFGLQRLSLTQLAARSAILPLASEGIAPSTWLGAEAVAARAVFEARHHSSLEYFGPVADTPGFPRALAQTVQELRLAHVRGTDVARLPLGGRDLTELVARVEGSFDAAARVCARGRAARSDHPPPPTRSSCSTCRSTRPATETLPVPSSPAPVRHLPQPPKVKAHATTSNTSRAWAVAAR